MKTMKTLTKEEAAAEIAEPLKLLKVSADTPPTGILPLHFPPKASRGMAFAYELAVITMEEFDDLVSSRFSLPEGWHLGQKIEAPRMLAEAAA